MKKKTALQQLIDKMSVRLNHCNEMIMRFDGDSRSDIYSCDGNAIAKIISQATELLETEREQIEEAYNNGAKDITYNLELKEQYYKETYE